jgi:hypothetical protein
VFFNTMSACCGPSTLTQQKQHHTHTSRIMAGYAYLFKYIIIGDSGNARCSRSIICGNLSNQLHIIIRCTKETILELWKIRIRLVYPVILHFYGVIVFVLTWLPAAVGKSCLLLQFTDKRFQPVHDLTIGK